jgi:hypothetical protein
MKTALLLLIVLFAAPIAHSQEETITMLETMEKSVFGKTLLDTIDL